MCRFANVPLPDGQPGPTSVKVCDGTGNMNACQLCPSSLTYWKLTDDGPVANPWDGTGESTLSNPADDASADPTPSAKWLTWPVPDKGSLTAAGWHMGPDGPCVLCLRMTKLRSPKDVPCHMACAAEYNAGRRAFAEPR